MLSSNDNEALIIDYAIDLFIALICIVIKNRLRG